MIVSITSVEAVWYHAVCARAVGKLARNEVGLELQDPLEGYKALFQFLGSVARIHLTVFYLSKCRMVEIVFSAPPRHRCLKTPYLLVVPLHPARGCEPSSKVPGMETNDSSTTADAIMVR